MPAKKKKSVIEGNIDHLFGDNKSKLRTHDGKYASDPIAKILGKKKK